MEEKASSEIESFVEQQNNESLWKLYGISKIKLKERGLIRTSNVVGERGEQLAIDYYCNTPNFPKLQAAPESTQNIDAISIKGERYSIKTISTPGKTTGVFYGLLPKDDTSTEDRKFEHLIIVILDKKLMPIKILELDWNLFLKYKKWHSRMNAWNISINKNLLSECNIILDTEKRNKK